MLLDLPKKDTNVLLNRISPVRQTVTKGNVSFLESHISADTFFENKYGFQEKGSPPPLVLHFQKRMFKTYRGDITLEGATVTERLKSKFLARREKLGGLQSGSSKEKLRKIIEAEQNDKLKGFIIYIYK